MSLISSRTVGCRICGSPRGDCTSLDHDSGTDHRVIEMEDQAMAEEKKKLSVYEVEQNGTTATFQLTDEDAKRMPGAKKRATSDAPSPGADPVGKARTAPNK